MKIIGIGIVRSGEKIMRGRKGDESRGCLLRNRGVSKERETGEDIKLWNCENGQGEKGGGRRTIKRGNVKMERARGGRSQG